MGRTIEKTGTGYFMVKNSDGKRNRIDYSIVRVSSGKIMYAHGDIVRRSVAALKGEITRD